MRLSHFLRAVLLLGILVPGVSAQDEPLTAGSGGVGVPKRTKTVAPEYPAEAQSQGIRGIVILELTIDRGGKVADARIIRSVPGLDEAALTAARQWTYEVTKVDGKPVSVRLTVPITFAMKLPEMTRQEGIPELRQGVTPPFPQDGKGPATVVVQVSLDGDGRVAEAQVAQGEAPWTNALMAALRTWRFAAEAADVTLSFRVQADFIPSENKSAPKVSLRLDGLRRSESLAGGATGGGASGSAVAPAAAPPTAAPQAPGAPTAGPPAAAPAATAPQAPGAPTAGPPPTAPAATAPQAPGAPTAGPPAAAPAATAPQAPGAPTAGPPPTAPAATAPQAPGAPTAGPPPTAPAATAPQAPGAPTAGPPATAPAATAPQAPGAPTAGPPAAAPAAPATTSGTPPAKPAVPTAPAGSGTAPAPPPASPSARSAAPPVEVISAPPPPTAPVVPETGTSALRDVVLEEGVPDLTRGRRPVAPPFARMSATAGFVEVQFSVSAGGTCQVQSVSGPDILKAAAEQTVISWQFRRTQAQRLFLTALFRYDGDKASALVHPQAGPPAAQP